MTPERWGQLREIFRGAIEHGPEARAAYLDQSCNGDATLRAEIEALLASHDHAEHFIETPAFIKSVDAITESPAETFEGGRAGPYELLREIGRGGMGTVYLARRADEQFEKLVAVKIVRRGLDTEDILRRFRNERQILASLEHPNIARLLDGGTTADHLPFLVMEYVEGIGVTDYCDQHSTSLRERLQIFRTICAGVQHAHQNLVVHRDLKPSNILITADGTPKLLDFGIAKVLSSGLAETAAENTRTELRVLTPDYASPEQVRGEKLATTSDVYSLGVVLYELLTGERPYRATGSGPHELARIICEQEPAKPSVAIADFRMRNAESKAGPQSEIRNPRSLRGDLDNIVLMALRKDPARRYSSVEQLSDDIRRYLEGLPVIARKDTFNYRASKFVRRNRIGVAAAGLILVTLVAGIAMTVREKRRADRRFNDVRHMANSFMFEIDDEIQKGPTKAREMLVKRALAYLDSLAQEAGNDSGLQIELAAAYLKVGDIQGKPYRPNLGDTAGALASYRKAQSLLETLVSDSPRNPEARRYLSLAYQSVGRAQGRDGDWSGALEIQQKAVAVSEGLLSTDTNNAQYRNLVADNYVHFGEALNQPERGATVADQHQAIAYFRKALAIHETLAAAEPGNGAYRYATGVDYEYIGIASNRLGDLTGDVENYHAALDNHRKELEINESLAASDPANATYRRILGDVYGEVGLSQLKLGMSAEALDNFRHMLTIFDAIRTADPTNVEAQRDVANSHHHIGQALAQSGNAAGAIVEERKAMVIYQTLSEAEPSNTEARENLIHSYEAMGELSAKVSDTESALANYKRAESVLAAWAASASANVSVRRLLAIERANIGDVYAHVTTGPQTSTDKHKKDWTAAQEWYQRSLNTWQELRAQGKLNETDTRKIAALTNDLAKSATILKRR